MRARTTVLGFLLMVTCTAYAATLRDGVVLPGSPEGSSGVAVADLDGDGRDDLVVTSSFCLFEDCEITVFHQTAAGTFGEPQRIATSSESSALAVGDVTGDGRPDIVLAHEPGVVVLAQNADGSFAAPQPYTVARGVYDLDLGDVNGDGRLDIGALPWGSNSDSMFIFVQQPDGTLIEQQYDMGGGGYDDFDLCDLNGDGLADAIVVSAQARLGTVYVRFANASGFDEMRAIDTGWLASFDAVDEGDFNSDGRIDLAVITYGDYDPYSNPYIGLLFQTADRDFTPGPRLGAYTWPNDILAADLDDDGDTDLAIAGGSLDRGNTVDDVLLFWMQIAPGVFAPDYAISAQGNLSHHDHLAAGDLNGDGRTDVVGGFDNTGAVVFTGHDSHRRSVRH